MRANIAAGLMLVCGGSILLAGSRPPRPGVDWPQFRGAFAHGVAEGFSTPVLWNVPQNKGVLWKAQLPQVSRVMMSLLGPGPNVWQCAGRRASATRGCETTWKDWDRARSASDG